MHVLKTRTMCHQLCLIKVFENLATSLGGGLIKHWNALLCRQPSSCMCVSDKFDREEHVAASMWKLWVL